RRSDCHVDARPPVHQGHPPRRDGRQGPPRRQGPGSPAQGALTGHGLKDVPYVPPALEVRTERCGARALWGAAALCAIKLSMAARPELIDARAADNLRFIREAMTRASAFTAIPGWGGVAMGVTAVAAAAVSGPPDNSLRWVMVWFVEAVVAVAIALP